MIKIFLILLSVALLMINGCIITPNNGFGNDDNKTANPITTNRADNQAPTVNAGNDKVVVSGETVVLKGTDADEDGIIVSRTWKEGATLLSETQSFNYVSTVLGVHTLTYSVTDDGGLTTSDSVDVNVTAVPSTNPPTVTTPTAVNLKQLSFYVWDGIVDYDLTASRVLAYDKPTIYLNPVDNGVNLFAVNSEILHAKGAVVWYLMSANPTLTYVQSQIDLMVQYNQTHTEQIIGMSFDIEPWTQFQDQNSSNNQQAWQAYLDFMTASKDMLHANNLKMSISYPFWVDRQTQAFPNARPINYDIIDIADEVIVMTYTVFADRIETYAQTSLSYAQSTNKNIKIALEMVAYPSDPNVSFYTHPEDIKTILDMNLNYTTFKGYMIHDLQNFLNSGIVVTAKY